MLPSLEILEIYISSLLELATVRAKDVRICSGITLQSPWEWKGWYYGKKIKVIKLKDLNKKNYLVGSLSQEQSFSDPNVLVRWDPISK